MGEEEAEGKNTARQCTSKGHKRDRRKDTGRSGQPDGSDKKDISRRQHLTTETFTQFMVGKDHREMIINLQTIDPGCAE